MMRKLQVQVQPFNDEWYDLGIKEVPIKDSYENEVVSMLGGKGRLPFRFRIYSSDIGWSSWEVVR